MEPYYKSSESCQITGLDALYEKYFGQIPHGMFVEVGAYDGVGFSNTWGLAEKGWTGLVFEPVAEYFDTCMLNHAGREHNIIGIMEAVGSNIGICNLYNGGVDSTIDKETVERSPFGFTFDPNDYRVVPVTTLDITLSNYNVSMGFELLCIDVEGAELQVLDGCSLDKWLPKMIIIETHVGVPGRDYHADEIIKRISDYGYARINDDALNTIFWHKNYIIGG